MGLGKSIKRLLPAALAAALGIGTIWYGQSVKLSQKPEVREKSSKKLRTWLLTGTGASLAALLAAYGTRRLKGKKEALMQSAVENPYTAGAVTAISYGATAYAQINDIATSAFCGLVPGIGVFTFSRALKLVNPPYWRNYPASVRDALLFQLSSDSVKKENILKRMRLYASDTDRVDISLVDFLFRNNKIDEGLEYLSTAVKANVIPKDQTLLEQHIVNPIEHEIIMGMRSKHPFLRFYSHFRMGEVDEAVKALDDFVGADISPSRSAARAYVFQHLSEHEAQLKPHLEEHVNRAWNDAIRKVLADPERERLFRPMGESRNEVMEYSANEFLKGLLVFKRCDIKDRERLINERETIIELRKRHGHDVVQSLAYVEHDGKAYHVLKHETSTTLGGFLVSAAFEPATDAWTSAARFLAKYHKSDFPWESPEITEDYYSNRLTEVFHEQLASRPNIMVSKELRDELGKTGRNVYQGLKDAPLGWYKDANWKNWLVPRLPMGHHSTVAIDFEHRIRLPVQLDLVSLRESASSSGDIEKRNVLETYLMEFGRPGDRRKFMAEYDWAGLQRHLELAGYRARDNDYEAARFHLKWARHYAMETGEVNLAYMLGKREHISIT